MVEIENIGINHTINTTIEEIEMIEVTEEIEEIEEETKSTIERPEKLNNSKK